MSEKNGFDILGNKGQDIIERIAAEFPPRDDAEKEKVFIMSERKFNDKVNSSTGEYESTVSGVEVYRRPVWKKVLGAAAAVVLAVGCTAGGIKAVKHFRNGSVISAESEIAAEKKTAPFGDFAEFDYKVCKCEERENTGEYRSISEFLGISECMELSDTRRERLADLFNNYDYEELTADSSYADQAAEDMNGPYFICDRDNVARVISVNSVCGEGILTYEEINYRIDDGRLVILEGSSSDRSWRIDYDLFMSAILEIIGTEEDTATVEETTAAEAEAEPVTYPEDGGIYPFRGFAEKEFWIYNSYKGDIDELPYVHIQFDGQGAIYSSRPRPALAPAKRRELEEFFAGLTWEEGFTDRENVSPWYGFDDTVTFDMLTDTEFTRIRLNLCNNILTVDSMEVEKVSGDGNYSTYRCTDFENKRELKIYSTDYPGMKEKLREILGDDFGSMNMFVDLDWEYSTDEMKNERRKLSEEEKQTVFDMLRDYEWSYVDVDAKGEYFIEPSQNEWSGEDYEYVALEWNTDVTSESFVIENRNGYTVVSTYGCELRDGRPVDSSAVMQVSVCDDNTIVRKIKEYAGR